MRLLIEIGHTRLLLSADADTNAILRALAGADIVDEKYISYDEPIQYMVARQPTRGIGSPVFIHDSQIIDEDEAAEVDADAT